MNRRQRILFSITGIFIVLFILVGLTYGYYSTIILGNQSGKSIDVISKSLKIVYQNESSFIEANDIEPGFSVTKSFEVKNSGNSPVSHSIIFDNVVNEFIKGQATRGVYFDWSYELYEGKYNSVTQLNTAIESGKTPIASGDITTDEKQVLVKSVSIDTNVVKSYTVIIRYANLLDVNQSDDMGSRFSLRINIAEEVTNAWERPDEGTLLYSIKTNNPVTSPITTLGQNSASNEAVLAETEGNGGSTYYFRGIVQNNYVTYSGMCWRIVRVMENGDIKITLADGEHPCGTANGYSVDDTTSAFIVGDYYYANISLPYSINLEDLEFKNSLVNDMLKKWAGTVEDRTHTYIIFDRVNETSQTITEPFSNPELDITKLSTTPNWCIDNSLYGKGEVGGIEGSDLFGASYYDLSLKCPVPFYNESQIGLLSANEILLAGLTDSIFNSIDNVSFYLSTNAFDNYFTLSPFGHLNASGVPEDYRHVYLFEVKGRGNIYYHLGSISPGTYSMGSKIRPTVVLRNDVTIQAGGDGTVDKPYVVN